MIGPNSLHSRAHALIVLHCQVTYHSVPTVAVAVAVAVAHSEGALGLVFPNSYRLRVGPCLQLSASAVKLRSVSCIKHALVLTKIAAKVTITVQNICLPCVSHKDTMISWVEILGVRCILRSVVAFRFFPNSGNATSTLTRLMIYRWNAMVHNELPEWATLHLDACEDLLKVQRQRPAYSGGFSGGRGPGSGPQ